MKLIIEKNYGSLYAYLESEKRYKRVRRYRGAPLDPALLGIVCDLEAMPQGHFEFDVNYRRKPRRSQTV